MFFDEDVRLYNIAYRFYPHLPRISLFGDSLNAINIFGIFVVNIGVLIYKVTLHLSQSENDKCQKIEEDSQYCLCIGDDDYDVDSNNDFNYEEDLSARRGTRRPKPDPGGCCARDLNAEHLYLLETVS